jgi:hypothetical protein
LRSLEEKAALNTELGQHASADGRPRTAERFATDAAEALHAAELIRQLVVDLGRPQDETEAAEPGSA